ncbi:hypothetical protein V8G54_022086 [Vigna mungo]|uniref:Transmembrane protein n=1 Tax=Vigna mungo TaxID=3915 RepID=A0AAQ3NGX2_VIGMU
MSTRSPFRSRTISFFFKDTVDGSTKEIRKVFRLTFFFLVETESFLFSSRRETCLSLFASFNTVDSVFVALFIPSFGMPQTTVLFSFLRGFILYIFSYLGKLMMQVTL